MNFICRALFIALQFDILVMCSSGGRREKGIEAVLHATEMGIFEWAV